MGHKCTARYQSRRIFATHVDFIGIQIIANSLGFIKFKTYFMEYFGPSNFLNHVCFNENFNSGEFDFIWTWFKWISWCWTIRSANLQKNVEWHDWFLRTTLYGKHIPYLIPFPRSQIHFLFILYKAVEKRL